MKKISKRYKKLLEANKDKKFETIEKVIDQVKANSNAKFVESVDLSFKINLKKIKSSDAGIRSAIELPNGSGKKIKVAVLCDENKLNEAKKSGAEVFGSDDLIKNISGIIIGFISVPLGIGGGSLMVPFMRTFGYDIRKSIGTAAAVGFLIAISGTITMIAGGKIIDTLIPHLVLGTLIY